MTKSRSQGILILLGLVIFILYKVISEIFKFLQEHIVLIGVIVGSGILTYLLYILYVEFYFRSKKFKKLKDRIRSHIENCNDLNHYIEELKNSYVNMEAYNYGSGNMVDNSDYNYQRKEWRHDSRNAQIIDCSASVCKNARNQPFKYLCKYFNLNKDEETLSKFEKVLNEFSSVEQGKELISKERISILNKISTEIPFLIKKYNQERLLKSLGFESVDISDSYFPSFTFQYVSPGGNSSLKCVIRLDIENLNDLINYLNDKIKWRKSVEGQRSLMTSSLRTEIKERDNYECCTCGNGLSEEPNLLLEIDHIIPLSKGGLTTYDNLQTLCWKCNRSKGYKILTEN